MEATIKIESKAVMTRQHLRKLSNLISATAGMMKDGDLAELTVLDNSIFLETDDTMSLVRLETQE